MEEITRFDMDMDGSMEPSEHGEWVRYEDAPQRKPLNIKTVKRIATYCDEHITDEDVIEITRRVEAAHGIKEQHMNKEAMKLALEVLEKITTQTVIGGKKLTKKLLAK